jgi:pimeloyl-ACP methyl ester carboxylesterase
MPYVNNGSVRIHYQVEGEGPALVLQHGFTESLVDWYEAGYVEALEPHYRLISSLMPGGMGPATSRTIPRPTFWTKGWRMLSRCWTS